MKFPLATLLICFFLVACDQPRDRRTAHEYGSANDTSPQFDGHPNFPNNNNQNNGGNNGGGGGYIIDDQGSGETSQGQVPTEVSHCTWPGTSGGAYASQHQHIGQYTVCQSNSKDTDVYVQVRNPITDSTLCLIPTYESGGKAIYIGEPRCFEAKDNDVIYRIGLLKNRSGYSNFNVTGVMMMRDKAYFFPAPYSQYLLSPDAYLFCAQWLDTYNDPTYCQAFDAVGQYVYHKF